LYVQIFLIILIIIRCVSSFNNLSAKDCIYTVILLLIGSADCGDLLNFITLKELKDNDKATFCVLLVFSVSIVQFSVVFSSTREARNYRELSKFQKIIEICFCTEIWSILLSLISQEIPFLFLRLSIVLSFELFSDMTFLIYIIKNITFVIVDLIRIYKIVKEFKANKRDVVKVIDC
jgi:hypothetical protein